MPIVDGSEGALLIKTDTVSSIIESPGRPDQDNLFYGSTYEAYATAPIFIVDLAGGNDRFVLGPGGLGVPLNSRYSFGFRNSIATDIRLYGGTGNDAFEFDEWGTRLHIMFMAGVDMILLGLALTTSLI